MVYKCFAGRFAIVTDGAELWEGTGHRAQGAGRRAQDDTGHY